MKKKCFPFLLSSFLLFGFLSDPKSVEAELSLPASSTIGEVVTLPSKTFSYNGINKEASILIKTPSGGCFTGKSLKIEEVGKYEIIYHSDFDGHEEKESYFIVVDRRNTDLFSSNQYASANSLPYLYDETFYGVKGVFNLNGELKFAKPIDLTKLDSDTPLVDFLIESSSQGEADFEQFNIKIEDIYDPSIYVNISFVDSGSVNCSGQGMYIKAGANNQTQYGYETDDKLWSDPSFGTCIKSSFRSLPIDNPTNSAKIYFDYNEKTLYASRNWFSSPSKQKIIDLDDKSVYPTDYFKGFKDGKVFLSFQAKGFNKNEGKVIFKSIAGIDLSSPIFLDEEAPKIDIDLDGSIIPPDATLGRKYKIFDAKAFDEYDGVKDVKKEVFYINSNDKKINVNIENGYFIPNQLGKYEIIYSAFDSFLNKSEVKYCIYAGINPNPINVYLDSNNLTGEVYSNISLPTLDRFEATRGNGRLVKSVLLIDPDGEVRDNPSFNFVPRKIGKYIARYQAFDYLGFAGIFDLEINVTNLSSPIFIDSISLPVAFAKGVKTTLPHVKALEPKGNEVISSSVSILINEEKLDGFDFVPSGDEVKVSYLASSLRKDFVVPVISLNNGENQDKYFFGNTLNSINEDNVSLKALENSKSTFVKTLNYSSFNIEFSFSDNKNDSLTSIILSEGDLNVSLLIQKHGENYQISTKNGESSNFVISSNRLSLGYNNKNKSISDISGNTLFAIEKDDKGAIFKGFTQSITLSLNIEKEETLYVYKINNQPFGKNGREVPLDEIGPELVFSSFPGVKQKSGSKIIVPSSSSFDVLNEIDNYSLTLIKPDRTRLELNPLIDNEISFDKNGSYRLEYVSIDSKGNQTKTIRLFKVYEEVEPELKLDSSLKEEYKTNETISIPSYVASDDSSYYVLNVILLTPDYERITLLIDENGSVTSYLDNDAELANLKVDSTSFRLKRAGNYSLIFNIRDRDYNSKTIRCQFKVVGD